MAQKVQKVMTQPIVRNFYIYIKKNNLFLQNLIFRYLQNVNYKLKIIFLLNFQKTKIQIWLFEQTDLRIEGRIIVIYFINKLIN